MDAHNFVYFIYSLNLIFEISYIHVANGNKLLGGNKNTFIGSH